MSADLMPCLCQTELKRVLKSLHSFCVVCQSCLSVAQSRVRNQVRLSLSLRPSLSQQADVMRTCVLTGSESDRDDNVKQ